MAQNTQTHAHIRKHTNKQTNKHPSHAPTAGSVLYFGLHRGRKNGVPHAAEAVSFDPEAGYGVF
jgi:hypothetical protein